MNTEKLNGSTVTVTQVKENAGFNIKEILLRYAHYSWLFMLMVAITLLGAWLYLRYTPPKYSVSATLLITNDNARGDGQDVFADFMLFKENTNKQNEIQILRSRKLMSRVVNTLGLQYGYYVVGNVKKTDIYKESPFELQLIPPVDHSHGLFLEIHFTSEDTFRIGENPKEYVFGQIIAVGGRKFRLIAKESPYSRLEFKDFIVRWLPMEQAAIATLGGLEIAPADDLSSVLKLTYVTENPLLGADIINTLMQEYGESGIEDKNLINRKMLSFIDDRLKFVEKQLDSVERDMQRYKTSEEVIDLTAQSQVYFNNMTEMTQGIRDQEIKLQVVGLLENYLKDPSRNLTLVPSTLGIGDNTLLELTKGYNDLLIQRQNELQTGATLSSPVVKKLESDIDEARQKLLRNLANIKSMYQETISSMHSQNRDIKNQLASVPGKERENRERTRQQEIKQNLYLYLLQKKEESGIAQASTIASSRVIDEALNSANQVSPNASRIYLIAVLAGLMLPIAVIYFLDLLNDKVTTRSDITKVTDAPIIAEIGHSREAKALLFPQNSRSLVAEQVRILRSNMRYLLMDKLDKHTILVTSSFSGEGKSFISINLGAALALSGKRTVILEFDLRKPKILVGLDLPKGQGLTNYLVGSTSLSQLPQAVTTIDNLYVIPCGPIPPNPSEILLSDKMQELFSWLKQQFDIIVIDTAPVGLVSDATTLSQYADATLYLVRQRYTNKRQLQFIQDLYTQKKLPGVGLVVNDVIAEGTRSYYGYGGGSYGYGYGYGSKNGYYEADQAGYWKKWRKKLIGKS